MKIKKLEIQNNKEKKKLTTVDMKKVLEKGSSVLSEGVSAAKHGAISATQGIVKMAETVGEKSKEVQMNVLTYIDQKKNARFLKAKLSAFEDGLKARKMQRVDYI